MNVMTGVTVERLDQKDVTTKFGSKPVFSFQAGGEWFKTGFKRHGLNVGDVASFTYVEGKFGKDVDPSSISKGGVAAATPAAAIGGGSSNAPAAAAVARPAFGGGKGVFPIPALDGQRAIVRQNSLTNAVKFAELIDVTSGGTGPDEYVKEVIRIARQFEAYSCGDLDAEEVEAEMAAEEGKASKKKLKAAA